MKKLVIALVALGIWSVASAETLNTAPYETAEYTANTIAPGKTNEDFLRVINASSAWARGYTGAGSKILIIDTGINLTANEFAGSISNTQSFVRGNYGILDQVGHGTAMAGIAAANRDGVGMVGVAPDAMLAIAKVSDVNSIGFNTARTALAWGNTIGATVANISANAQYDVNWNRNWYQLADGSYANKITTYYGGKMTGFYMNEDPKTWATALGTGNMVIVNSAGNNGLRMPELPAPMAIATNADGTLTLGGRMLIVGAYDINYNTIATYSNKAGHVCQGKNIVGGNCLDTYHISDFYIMAPGNVFAPSKTGDLYTISTGTSEAAAVVSGAVAVVHQAWPLMTGSDVVKLLLQTANKNMAGYDVNVMGQGLLDMEKATRPVGVVGVPTGGNLTGTTTKVALSGSFSTNTSAGLSAVSAKLSSVMVVDDYNRDFYVNLAPAGNTKHARADYNPVAKAQFFENYNPYGKLNYYSFNSQVASGAYDFKMSTNEYSQTALVEMGKTTKLNDHAKMRLGFGTMNEQKAWMGNQISGALGQVDSSHTQFMNVSGVYDINKRLSAFGSVWMGYTQANLQSAGLVTNVGATESYSWNMGLDYTKDQHSFGATLSQPVTVSSGTVDLAIPIGYTANGVIAYDRSTVNITPNIHEYDVGMYYKYRTDSINLIAYGEHQINYLNQAGVSNQQIGVALNKDF